jgi:hypothetical protein
MGITPDYSSLGLAALARQHFRKGIFPAYSLWYRPRFCNSGTTFDETYGGATEKIEAMGIVYPFYWSIIPSASRYCYVMIKRVLSLPLFAIKSF